MTDDQTKAEQLQQIGRCAMDSIREMVDALNCDYDRLEELREEKRDWPHGEDYDEDTWEEAYPEDAEELKQLEEAAGDCSDEDDARTRIEEDPLSLQIRSDWHTPGEEADATEFELLLSTGGPATRIIGTLNACKEPQTAKLQAQDWFTPWTDINTSGEDDDALLAYAAVFHYGE